MQNSMRRTGLPWSIAMSLHRKVTLLAGTAACLFALVYAAPIFGAAAFQTDAVVTAQNPAEDEALMAPLRFEAQAALARLEARSVD
jgi:hypothetical protein